MGYHAKSKGSHSERQAMQRSESSLLSIRAFVTGAAEQILMIAWSSAKMQDTSDRLENSILGLLSLHASPGDIRAATSEAAPFPLNIRGCDWPLEVLSESCSSMYQIPESPTGGALLIGRCPA
jgi:hypothetical protein